MNSTKSVKNTLFLHMGPGFNAYTERKMLGENNKNIEFWDQPVIENSQDAFRKLLNATATKLEEMYQDTQEPIHLVAHSFGAYIAVQLLKTHPHFIGSLKVFNSSYNIVDGYLTLLKKMADNTTDSEMKSQINAFLSSNPKSLQTGNLFDKIISLVTMDPMYIQHYFYSPKQLEAYINVASNAEPMNILMFKNVLVDFVDHYFKNELMSHSTKPISIVLGGASDPFFTSQCEKSWKALFPQAKIIVEDNIGHFVHLERGV